MNDTCQITRTRNDAWWMFPRGNPDLLFAEDGSVKLPKLTSLAIEMALRSHGCLSRQPTRERAEAVQAAVADLVSARGMSTEIRRSDRSCMSCDAPHATFGLYLALLPEDAANAAVSS